MEKLGWIDKAKGIGVLGVIAVHVLDVCHFHGPLEYAVYAGKYCVQLFFAISAYLTFLSLEKHPILNFKGYLKYILHKFLRLAPVLWLAIVLNFLIYAFSQGSIPQRTDSIWFDIFVSMTMINGFFYHHANPFINWYVGTLVQFLLIAPLLRLCITNTKKSIMFFYATVFIASFTNFILPKIGIDTHIYFEGWIMHQLAPCAFGILFYYFERDSLLNKSKTIILFCLSFLLLSILRIDSLVEVHVRFGVILFLFCYLLFNLYKNSFNWLKVVGANSYSFYLLHWPILIAYRKILIGKQLLYKMQCGWGGGYIFSYLLIFLCTFGITLLSNKLYTKFIMK